jgi:hypothetical protein
VLPERFAALRSRYLRGSLPEAEGVVLLAVQPKVAIRNVSTSRGILTKYCSLAELLEFLLIGPTGPRASAIGPVGKVPEMAARWLWLPPVSKCDCEGGEGHHRAAVALIKKYDSALYFELRRLRRPWHGAELPEAPKMAARWLRLGGDRSAIAATCGKTIRRRSPNSGGASFIARVLF